MNISDGYFVKDANGVEHKVLSTNVVGYRVETPDGTIKTLSYDDAGFPYMKKE